MLLSTVSFAATGLVPPAQPLQNDGVCQQGAHKCLTGAPGGGAVAPGTCVEWNGIWKLCEEVKPGQPGYPGNCKDPGAICCVAPSQCSPPECTSHAECDDGNACTDDACVDNTCVNTNNTASCDDGNACTTGDACSDGTCVGGPDLDCDDDNVCTDDSCEPASGCVNTNNTASCDDLDPCTDPDVCSGGTCVPGPNICECETNAECDDGNVCTDDACVDNSCVYTNNTKPCDDLDACTDPDVCSGGACVGGPAPDCDDDNVCTDDSCDPAKGCVHTNNTASCDDGNECTEPDACANGVCVGGGWVCGECQSNEECDDENACSTDSCVDNACVFTAISCDDGLYCNGAETCDPELGCQAGTPPDCDDGDICTDDSCDEANNTCAHVFDASNDPSCVTICENATITVQVTECGAGVAGLSVELHSSYGDVYGPKTSPATFSVIGGSDRLWYAIVNGATMGPSIKVTECGGTGSIGAVLYCAPTPTPVVEVLGVERLPVTGEMPLAPVLPSLPMILSSLSLIGSGLLLRRKE